MKTRTAAILLIGFLSTHLYAYYLGQHVPLKLNYKYWNKNQNFDDYTDINDWWICDNVNTNHCTCGFQAINAQCIVALDGNFSNTEPGNIVDKKNDYKLEEFNSLTIVDINDTFSELDSFQGYDQNKNSSTNLGNHPVEVSQDYYILFDSSYVRAATAQETQDTDDFLQGIRDSTSFGQGTVLHNAEDENFTSPDIGNNLSDGVSEETKTADPADTLNQVSNQLGISSGELSGFQDDIASFGNDYSKITDGAKKFVTSNIGGVNFDSFGDVDFLSDYVNSDAANKILGQLGLSGSINCYVKPPKYKLKTKFNVIDTQVCIFKDGQIKENNFKEMYGGAFGTEELGLPKCNLQGEFSYDASSDTCTGCDDLNAFWDKNTDTCKSCEDWQTYDKELNTCVDKEYSYSLIGDSEAETTTYDYFWIARCSKKSFKATIVYTGKEEHEPPGGIECGVYSDYPVSQEDTFLGKQGTISSCSSTYDNKCSWLPAENYTGADGYVYSFRNMTPNPYPNSDFVIDYRINSYTHGSLWGKNERRDNWNYGLIYFYRKYTTVIPMPYSSNLNFHGWTPLRSELKEHSEVFDSWKSYDLNWTKADVKYTSSIKIEAKNIKERMFICDGNKFVWWSDKSEDTGKNVSGLKINTCQYNPEEGWNDLLDKNIIGRHNSKYYLDHSLKEGKHTIKFGIYDSAHPNDGSSGHATATYKHKKLYEPITVPAKHVAAEWGGHHRDIGCELTLHTPKIPSLCTTIKADVEIKFNPMKPNSPVIAKRVEMSPAQMIVANYSDATSVLSSNNIVRKESNETIYPSGISKKDLNDATDIDNIFSSEDRANSPYGNAIITNNSEVTTLLKSYMKTKQGGDNCNFIGTPNPNAIGKAITKTRIDFLGLPADNNETEVSIAGMSHMLSESYSILNFEQNTLLYLNTQFAAGEGIPNITKPTEIETVEQKIFKNFVESNSTTEAKALIEKKIAERYAAIKRVSDGDRLTSQTRQRLKSLHISDKLTYISIAQKQMLKDAYIAAIFSKIGKFKTAIFNDSIGVSRVNAKPVYGKIMGSNLEEAVKWSQDKIR